MIKNPEVYHYDVITSLISGGHVAFENKFITYEKNLFIIIPVYSIAH